MRGGCRKVPILLCRKVVKGSKMGVQKLSNLLFESLLVTNQQKLVAFSYLLIRLSKSGIHLTFDVIK